MADRYMLSEILGPFKGFYQTVDVRTAIVKQEDSWRAICLAVRLLPDTINCARAKFHEIEGRFGKVDSPHIKILQDCYSFDQFGTVAAGLTNEDITQGEVRALLDKTVDLVSLPGCIEARSLRDRSRPDSDEWPVFRASTSPSNGVPLHHLLQGTREILRAVELAGYRDPYSAIRHLVQIDFGSSHPVLVLVVVEAAIPISLVDVRASRGEKGVLVVDISVTGDQTPVRVRCTIRQERRDLRQRIMQQQTVGFAPSGTHGNWWKWKGRTHLECLEGGWYHNDWIYVELVHEDIGRLYWEGFPVRELLRPEERNPLFVALTKFCQWEQIKHLLESPDTVRAPAGVNLKNKGRLFEISVQWLLSCLGFMAIWLHGYEKVQDGEFDYGSIDCLAYHNGENVLLLVNCTTAPPDPHDVNRHLELQHLFQRKFFDNTTVRVRSVLFTSAYNPEEEAVHYTPGLVKIFYREHITKLLALVESGQERRILDAILRAKLQDL